MAAKALVLGGGGVTGVAWEIGLLAGLAGRGVDLTDADLVVGTSAGAITGACLRSGASLAELYQAQLEPPGPDPVPRLSTALTARLGWAMISGRDQASALAKIGKMALAARTPLEQDRRALIAARLPSDAWPAGRLLVTAVDTGTGELAVFDTASGVSLVDAVSASCAMPGVWPPVTIGGRRYMDGGMRSPANVDLAGGCLRVVVLAPVTRGLAGGSGVTDQVAELTMAGTLSTLIEPDAAAARAIGRNLLDPRRAGAAARAGFRQAAEAAQPAAAVWAVPAPS